MTFHSYLKKIPTIHPSVFIAPGVQIIGDVTIGKDSGVWFNSVIRGDVNSVSIGERTNIQDGCVLHVTHETGRLVIGDDVTVGHGAILHGCELAGMCLVGMGAIILDNAKINSYTLVAAGAMVRTQALFPEGVLIAGVPARVVRELTPDERTMIEGSARWYVGYAQEYRKQQL
jgi:carbonic anhydrase/acetyltransferase-like protein (isoleucine patch superfamily)